MSVTTTAPWRQQIDYPESDGRPTAETDLHRQEMLDAIDSLTDFFRAEPEVYVAGNLLLYYEEGNPSASVAPDVFVVKGVPKGYRRTYKLWDEGQPPTIVLEITSRFTRLEDLGNKRALYALLGVREYFLFDPLAEYLVPPLHGYVLVSGEYRRLDPDVEDSLPSRALGLRLRMEYGRLRLINAATGERLLRPAEAREQARAEAEARRAAEQRLADSESELARLRSELARLRGEDPTG